MGLEEGPGRSGMGIEGLFQLKLGFGEKKVAKFWPAWKRLNCACKLGRSVAGTA